MMPLFTCHPEPRRRRRRTGAGGQAHYPHTGPSPSSRLRMTLARVVTALEKVYGPPVVRVTDPFEMIVLENAAYLVDDARRHETFERLRAAIGVTPEAIAKRSRDEIAEVIAGGGMLPEHRAEKVLECARLAVKSGVTEKTLRKFPSIGEP